jgi:hypothetical protein
MKHTDSLSNDFVWTKPGTCISTRWRQSGWIPPSEQQSYKDKWAKYQEMPTRSLQDIPAHSVEHI